jgi:predicted transposase/invertase (TIGR01784 family)
MRFLNPRNDVAFKKIFGSDEHKNVTISFLNSLLEYKNEKAIVDLQFKKPTLKNKNVWRYDTTIVALATHETGKKSLINIHLEKIEFWFSHFFTHLNKKYDWLSVRNDPLTNTILPVISIVITEFIRSEGNLHYKTITTSPNMHDVDTTGKTIYCFIELSKFQKAVSQLSTDEEKWLYFLKNITDHSSIPDALANEFFVSACRLADYSLWTLNEYERFETAAILFADQQGIVEYRLEESARKIEEYGSHGAI